MESTKQESNPYDLPNNKQDDDWAPTNASAEIDLSDLSSIWLELGGLATAFTDRPEEENQTEQVELSDDQDGSISSLDDLIAATLTPEQQQGTREVATELIEAIIEDEELASKELADKLMAMEQTTRDYTIKQALDLSQNEYAREPDELDAEVGYFGDMTINRVTDFMTDHRLFLENYDGLAETTVLFLEKLPDFPMSVDEPSYAYFVNGVLNDEKMSKQVKSVLKKRKYELDVSTISQSVIIDKFKSELRDTRNLADFAKGLKNIGYDIASNDTFIEDCVDNSVIDDFYPDAIPLQDNLYRAGLINDDNIGRLYDQLIKEYSKCGSRRGMNGISLSLCPDSKATRYWRQFQMTSQIGIISPSDHGITSELHIHSFRDLLDCVDQKYSNKDFSKFFEDGIPSQQYYDRLQSSPLLTNDEEVGKFISCLGDMPLTPEIYNMLGQSQTKALDMYKEWCKKGAPSTFLGLASQHSITGIDYLIDLIHKADSFLGKYPLANLAHRESVINAHAQGKDSILGEEYFGDLVLYNCRADQMLSTMDDESIEVVRRHLDTLSRFNLFDGDRARMVNYAVLTEYIGRAGPLFDELATVDELDEATRNSLNLVLRTRNKFGIKTVEELKNYRAVIAERATGDLVSNYVGDACRAISFIMLSDFDGYDLSCFDLDTLGHCHVLGPDDVAVINLFCQINPINFGLKCDDWRDMYIPPDRPKKEISNGEATEKLLRIIADSPLCVPVEDESGVAKITKIEGSASDLISKLRHYIIDDWNKSLIDLEATGEGIEHLTIEEGSSDGAIGVVKLTGAPFKMLSHTVYGQYINPDVYRALLKDPGVWNTAQGSATISTSCIDEKHYGNYLRVGSDEASRVLLGFNHIQPGGIVAMAPNDGYLRGSLKLEMGGVEFTTCDGLMHRFDQVKHLHSKYYHYNEVGLSRMSSEPGARNGRLQPSHIIVHGSSTDDINENSKKFARYFGVPITLIDDEAYRKKYNVDQG